MNLLTCLQLMYVRTFTYIPTHRFSNSSLAKERIREMMRRTSIDQDHFPWSFKKPFKLITVQTTLNNQDTIHKDKTEKERSSLQSVMLFFLLPLHFSLVFGRSFQRPFQSSHVQTAFQTTGKHVTILTMDKW